MKTYSIPKIKLSYVSDSIMSFPLVKSSESIIEVLRDQFDEDEIEYRESFIVVYLNRQHRVLGIHEISKGGTTSTLVDIKMILTGALLANAQAVIIAHNHPSGNKQPSIEDDKLTKKIKNGCEAVDIKLLDHIILTKYDSFSYNDNGKI